MVRHKSIPKCKAYVSKYEVAEVRIWTKTSVVDQLVREARLCEGFD